MDVPIQIATHPINRHGERRICIRSIGVRAEGVDSLESKTKFRNLPCTSTPSEFESQSLYGGMRRSVEH